MTLSSALRTATSSLSSTSQQAAVTSRNIAGIGDPNYIKRDAAVVTNNYGTTRVETNRVVNQALFDSSLMANAKYAKSDTIATSIDRLASFQQLNEFSNSAASLLGELKSATEFAAATPSDNTTLNSLVENARTMATTLNSSYTEIMNTKTDIDSAINSSVNNLKSMLSQLTDLNDTIVEGTRFGTDVFDELDIRDSLLNDISTEIGINVVNRANNDVMLTLNNGVVLFETKPREIEFQAMPSYGASTTGSNLFVDGVAVTGDDSRLPIYSGAIAGNFELRDKHMVNQQNQLDEIARGLIDAYSEKDQTGGGKPALAGLFTWSGGPGVPTSGLLQPGIAATLSVNEIVDHTKGGTVSLIRDGAINGDTDYLSNSEGGASYSDRLYELSANIDKGMVFDGVSGLPENLSLQEFADQSLDQFNALRQSATDSSDYLGQLSVGFKEALQNENGVNLDYEMSRLLEIERAYQATAKLLSTVDEMLETLIASV